MYRTCTVHVLYVIHYQLTGFKWLVGTCIDDIMLWECPVYELLHYPGKTFLRELVRYVYKSHEFAYSHLFARMQLRGKLHAFACNSDGASSPGWLFVFN